MLCAPLRLIASRSALLPPVIVTSPATRFSSVLYHFPVYRALAVVPIFLERSGFAVVSRRSADNNAAISRATPPPPTPFRVSTSPKRRGIPLQYRRVILSWPAPLRFISCVLRDIRVAVRLHNVFSVARVGAPVVPVSIEHPVLAPH